MTGKLRPDTATVCLPKQNLNNDSTHRYANAEGEVSLDPILRQELKSANDYWEKENQPFPGMSPQYNIKWSTLKPYTQIKASINGLRVGIYIFITLCVYQQ